MKAVKAKSAGHAVALLYEREDISAAAAGAPVSAISREFAELVGPKSAKLAQVKQYVGLCIRAVLEQEGYDIERTGVWLGNDPVLQEGERAEHGSARRLA